MKFLNLIIVIIGFVGCTDTDQCKYPIYKENLDIIKSENSEKAALKAIKDLISDHHIIGYEIKDVYQRALNIDDEMTLKLLYQYLKRKGVPRSYFYKLWDYEWCSVDESSYGIAGLEIRSQIIALEKMDNQFNEEYHAWRKGEIEMSKEQLIDKAGKIISKFKEIVDEYGFPSEEKIGYNFKRGDYHDTPIGILLIHIYQRGDRLYFDQLDSLRCTEDISNSLYSTLQTIKGFGNHEGYKAEMDLRYNKFKQD